MLGDIKVVGLIFLCLAVLLDGKGNYTVVVNLQTLKNEVNISHV